MRTGSTPLVRCSVTLMRCGLPLVRRPCHCYQRTGAPPMSSFVPPRSRSEAEHASRFDSTILCVCVVCVCVCVRARARARAYVRVCVVRRSSMPPDLTAREARSKRISAGPPPVVYGYHVEIRDLAEIPSSYIEISI
jgi:hypothetical protein